MRKTYAVQPFPAYLLLGFSLEIKFGINNYKLSGKKYTVYGNLYLRKF